MWCGTAFRYSGGGFAERMEISLYKTAESHEMISALIFWARRTLISDFPLAVGPTMKMMGSEFLNVY